VIAADEAIRDAGREMSELVDGLVRAAQEEGSLRPDVGSGDVIHLFTLLVRDPGWMADLAADIAFERARAIILDGLRARPGTPLPGQALTNAYLDTD
jgi:hypothetical protein